MSPTRVPMYLENLNACLYADDTVLFVGSEPYMDTMLKFRIELETVKQWLYLNCLMLHLEKKPEILAMW